MVVVQVEAEADEGFQGLDPLLDAAGLRTQAVAVLPQGLYLPLQAVELGLKLVHHQLDWQGTVHLPVGDLQGGDHRPETDQ
jgi:hypothetical protein